MIATAQQLARTASDWTRTAGEPVKVEQIRSTLYGFCGELGALRLLRAYRWTLINRGDIVRVIYSDNMRTWAFALDLTTDDPTRAAIPAPNNDLSTTHGA